MIRNTEGSYLKAIYSIDHLKDNKGVTTGEIAKSLSVTSSTASNMLKKLKDKGYVTKNEMGGIVLQATGKKIAISLIRKHRLWNTFLYEKMDFTWEEINEVAVQLEQVKSDKLMDNLSKLLGNPTFDPYGEPIPAPNGECTQLKNALTNTEVGKVYTIVAVNDNSPAFLHYASEIGIVLKAKIKTLTRYDFDGSREIEVDGISRTISLKVAENIYVV